MNCNKVLTLVLLSSCQKTGVIPEYCYNETTMIDTRVKTARPAQEAVNTKKKIIRVTEKENVPLLTVSTVFPFTLFPDSIEIYVERIVLNYRTFYLTKEVFPIIIKDLISVSANTNLIFGSVKFDITFSHYDPDPIHFLWRKDALKVSRYVTGLLAAHKLNLDLDRLSRSEILKYVDDLGRTKENITT
jgi:hypothetical protein